MDMSKYRRLFIDESRGHLENLSRILATDTTAIDEIFRHVHSVKGMAASMAYTAIAELSHVFEDVVGARKNAGAPLEVGLVDVLLVAVDTLSRQVTSVEADTAIEDPAPLITELKRLVTDRVPDAAAAPAPAAPAPTPQQAVPVVRVRADTLDNLLDAVGELFITRSRIRATLGATQDPEVRAALDELDARVRDVQAQALAVRMTPLRTLTERYARLVRDTERALDKRVVMTVEGEGIELDRAILEQLDAPLVHILRNAIDHGIETPQQRTERDKEPTGHLKITAAREHDVAVITVEDDGAGLDADQLVRAAVKKGLITESRAEVITQNEAFHLICLPGFSTKQEVSDISGRGVGMDVVRAHIETLGGTLGIDSELGRGTRITLRVPLTLSIIDVLRIEVGGHVLAIPLSRVATVRDTATDVIHGAGGERFLSLRQALAPLHELATLLGTEAAPAAQAVVVEDARNLVALGVERAVAVHEVVVKPVGWPLERFGWILGATVLGDGRPIVIIDPGKLLRARGIAT
jgi:two-component system chemotaxis sensor kinase CheA